MSSAKRTLAGLASSRPAVSQSKLGNHSQLRTQPQSNVTVLEKAVFYPNLSIYGTDNKLLSRDQISHQAITAAVKFTMDLLAGKGRECLTKVVKDLDYEYPTSNREILKERTNQFYNQVMTNFVPIEVSNYVQHHVKEVGFCDSIYNTGKWDFGFARNMRGTMRLNRFAVDCLAIAMAHPDYHEAYHGIVFYMGVSMARELVDYFFSQLLSHELGSRDGSPDLMWEKAMFGGNLKNLAEPDHSSGPYQAGIFWLVSPDGCGQEIDKGSIKAVVECSIGTVKAAFNGLPLPLRTVGQKLSPDQLLTEERYHYPHMGRARLGLPRPSKGSSPSIGTRETSPVAAQTAAPKSGPNGSVSARSSNREGISTTHHSAHSMGASASTPSRAAPAAAASAKVTPTGTPGRTGPSTGAPLVQRPKLNTLKR